MSSLSSPPTFLINLSQSSSSISPFAVGAATLHCDRRSAKSHLGFRWQVGRIAALPESRPSASPIDDEVKLFSQQNESETVFPQGISAIVPACFVGLVTGVAVVVFNNAVHEIRDFFWDGIPYQGASWLRDQPIEETWQRIVLVPLFGGVVVSLLNELQTIFESQGNEEDKFNVKGAVKSFLKAVAASVTLGTGNSLGPEGPSVEIGSSVAKGCGTLFNIGAPRKMSLVAAGSAAGIASGFNAAVAGCFFAVESVLWPSPSDSSQSLPNTTSMVILSAVIASVVSEIGLGSEPAFKVPGYDFRSPSELPLYLLLGLLCGLVSLALSRCTSNMMMIFENAQKASGLPKALFPVMGSLACGLIALAYPEILYRGFQNVDLLLESRPFVKGLSAGLLVQLVAAKIVATSLCRASGLVGGYYAPSLYIGAATGMAYGKFINDAVSQTNGILDFSILEVASPQAYGLVGMAATLAGVCQVPLTSVLLLFELTQDYRIVLPLLGAVGVSSWITSGQSKRGNNEAAKKFRLIASERVDTSLGNAQEKRSRVSFESDLCEIESSLCIDESPIGVSGLGNKLLVSQAMRSRFPTVLIGTLLAEVVTLMLSEKQSCAVIVDGDNLLVGLLTLGDIQEFSKTVKAGTRKPKVVCQFFLFRYTTHH
uniref:Chloride channel protein n=1 Tax=Kalanchoe fedtschenkoi TaxID=63787 RepID=A0A7N0U5A7_KALFE